MELERKKMETELGHLKMRMKQGFFVIFVVGCAITILSEFGDKRYINSFRNVMGMKFGFVMKFGNGNEVCNLLGM